MKTLPLRLLPVFFLFPASLFALTDEFEDDPVTGGDWELYQPGGPGIYRTDDSKWIVTMPAGVNLDHWSGADRAIQLRRSDMPEDFTIETRIFFAGSGDPLNPIFPPVNEAYQAGLMVYFSQFDVFYWGPYRGTNIRLERSGQGNLCNRDPLIQEYSLQVKKIGTQYIFSWREDDADPWIEVCSRAATQLPQFVGLIFKSWAPTISQQQTFEFLYFKVDAIPESAPKFQVLCPFPDPDKAWLGMPYIRAVGLDGFPPPDISVVSGPPGLTFDAGQRLVRGWTPGNFDPVSVEIEAANTSGVDSLKFNVDVNGSSSKRDDDFDDDPRDFTLFWEFYEPQMGINYTTVDFDGSLWWRMEVPVTGALGSNFDTWVGVDRAPQLRRAVEPDKDFLIETRVRIDPQTPPTAGAPFLAGLLLVLNSNTDIIHWNIGQQRTIAGQQTNIFLERSGINNIAHGWAPNLLTGAPVRLRIEKRCTQYHFFYRNEGDDAWTHSATYSTPDPVQYVGLVMKTWGGGAAFNTDFDYFDFVEPGPRASFTMDPVSGAEPLTVNLDASAASSPGGAITAFDWDFGDGTTAMGPVQTHTYNARGKYRVRLRVTDASGDRGESSRTVDVQFRSEDVSPWTVTQVGAPSPTTGGARFDGADCMKVFAGGGAISLREDRFLFIHQQITGDARIEARLHEASWTTLSRIGLMIREDLSPGSRHASLLFQNAITNTRFTFVRRETTGGPTPVVRNASETSNPPNLWARVERQGQVLIASYSLDGAAWTELSRVTLTAALPDTLVAGLVAAANTDDAVVDARLCNIQITGTQPPVPPPTGLTAAAGDAKADLQWTAPAGAVAGYNVYQVSPGARTKLNPTLLTATRFTASGLANGTEHCFVVRSVDAGSIESADSNQACATPEKPAGVAFKRGDVDTNGAVEITDPINLLGFLFLGEAQPPCFDAADSDDNGSLEITDAIVSLGFQFLGEPPPPAPGPLTCGIDPTAELPGADYGCVYPDAGCR